MQCPVSATSPALAESTGCVESSRLTFKRYNFDTGGLIFTIFFTAKFRKDLRRKLELKSPPPLKSAAALPCEM